MPLTPDATAMDLYFYQPGLAANQVVRSMKDVVLAATMVESRRAF